MRHRGTDDWQHRGLSMPDQRSAAFRAMAERIDHNEDAPFGGAFVIIPPGGDAQDMLLLDNSGNPAIFWSTLQVRVKIALQEIEDSERRGGFMGR